ncbi:hypothetical protein MAP00_004484 [Monascus purpureus]|nr:hypothetical protein MAP00_004484 [Monascus purpureus]
MHSQPPRRPRMSRQGSLRGSSNQITPGSVPSSSSQLSRDLSIASLGQSQRKHEGYGTKKHITVITGRVHSTDDVPSLYIGSLTSSPTVTTLDTKIMASEPAGNNTVLEEDETGALIVSRNASPAHHPGYMCLFHILNCYETFDNAEQWKTHILSHFRTHPPPKSARCPLCPDKKFTTNSSSTLHSSAWDLMLDHIITVHYHRGQTLAGSRPDFELMQYLYRLRIISDAQFKTIQLAPSSSSPAYHRSQDSVRESIGSTDEPYYAPYSRRREKRLRSHSRGISVA